MFRFSIKVKTEMQSWKDRFIFLLCRSSENYKIHWNRVFLHSSSCWLKMWAKQKAKKIPTSISGIFQKALLWKVTKRSLEHYLLPDLAERCFLSIIFASMLDLECKSSSLNGLQVHLSAGRVFPFVKNNLEKKT